jgi:hypothetical protein
MDRGRRGMAAWQATGAARIKRWRLAAGVNVAERTLPRLQLCAKGIRFDKLCQTQLIWAQMEA